MTAFTGFPEQALVFYEGLEADNSKAYWTDHREVYREFVLAPFEALLRELEPEFGAGKMFRPYRDVRFSKDKTLYKTQASAVVDGPEGSLYVQLSADGLLVAGGYWHTQSDQVARLRAAVADEAAGADLLRVLATLEATGFTVSGERIRTTPRGYDRDHPRIALLQHKTLTAALAEPPQEWLHTAQCRDHVVQAWRALAPLSAWLGRHVGPSREPARSRR